MLSLTVLGLTSFLISLSVIECIYRLLLRKSTTNNMSLDPDRFGTLTNGGASICFLPRAPIGIIPQEDRSCQICHNEYRTDIEECCLDGFYRTSDNLEKHGGQEIPLRLPCNHHFGRACLRKWMASSNTCPLCRTEFWRGPGLLNLVLELQEDLVISLREERVPVNVHQFSLKDSWHLQQVKRLGWSGRTTQVYWNDFEDAMATPLYGKSSDFWVGITAAKYQNLAEYPPHLLQSAIQWRDLATYPVRKG